MDKNVEKISKIKDPRMRQLFVHHISHWSDDPINRINLDNGITLCNKCHSAEHAGDWYSNLVDASDTT